MSVSTQSAFRVPGALGWRTVASVRLVPACALLPGRFRDPLAFASPAVGVGHAATTRLDSKPPRARAFSPGAPFRSCAPGVGQRAASISGALPWRVFEAPEPLVPSEAIGVGHAAAALSDGWVERPIVLWLSESARMGVGHEEESLSPVWGSHISGAESGPLHRVTTGEEAAENRVQAPPNKSWNVLDDDDAGALGSDDVEHVEPEPRSLAGETGPPGVGCGEVLAGEPAADEVDRGKPIWVSGERLDISIPPGVGPVAGELFAADAVNLALPDDGPKAGTLKPQFEPTDAGEEGTDSHRNNVLSSVCIGPPHRLAADWGSRPSHPPP